MPSFVPDTALAKSIRACIQKKVCEQESAPQADLQLGIQAGLDQLVAGQASLEAQDECLLDAVQAAFDEAGETMPTLPSAPALPDTTDTQTFLDDLATALPDMTDPLGPLGSVITITFDGDGIPTLISW